MHDPRRIAIFRMGHLGDTIVALPAFWTVRRRFPEAKVLFLAQEYRKGTRVQQADVLRRGTFFDDYLPYRLGEGGVSKLDALRALVRLRFSRIDMLVYIPPERSPAQIRRDRLFFRLAGIKRIVGLEGLARTDYHPQGSPLPTVAHEADILLRHLAEDGVRTDDDPRTMMALGLTDEERAVAARWMAEKGIDLSRPIVGIGPGSKMPSKLWPVERFVEVARALETEFAPTFVLFGNGAEREICARVAESVGRGVNAAGELSVRESAAVFERCALYLGNDTGTMHIAASAGVRCVAIFSARDWPGRWYPYGKGHAVFRVAVPCEGCMLEICDRGNLCTLEIGTDRVVEAAARVLRERLSAEDSP